jgi:transcriptional regulator
MGDAPADYLDAMLRHIVGIEVRITSLVGKSKLSQNKEPRDRHNAADTLDARGQAALARSMREAS